VGTVIIFVLGSTKRFFVGRHLTIKSTARASRHNALTKLRDDMKRLHAFATLPVLLMMLAVGTAAISQGGFYLRAQLATNDGALFAVYTDGCERPENARVVGSAEGLVDGVRQTQPITLSSKTKGLYDISWERPEQGEWVLTLTGTYRGAVSSIIVPVGDDGRVRLPEPDRYGIRIKPLHRALTAADISHPLETIAVAG
jgi:hypothetical protein